jgi:hypothetical protein
LQTGVPFFISYTPLMKAKPVNYAAIPPIIRARRKVFLQKYCQFAGGKP